MVFNVNPPSVFNSTVVIPCWKRIRIGRGRGEREGKRILGKVEDIFMLKISDLDFL